jgi:hypothetical protein
MSTVDEALIPTDTIWTARTATSAVAMEKRPAAQLKVARSCWKQARDWLHGGRQRGGVLLKSMESMESPFCQKRGKETSRCFLTFCRGDLFSAPTRPLAGGWRLKQ